MQSPRAVATLMKLAKRSWREDGQDLLEYGLLMALIAMVAIGAVGAVGQTIYTIFWTNIANNF